MEKERKAFKILWLEPKEKSSRKKHMERKSGILILVELLEMLVKLPDKERVSMN